MSEPMDDFERRLSDGLRAWTDGAPRPVDFAEEARMITSSAARQNRYLGFLVAGATVLAAAGLTLAALNLFPLDRQAGVTGSAPPSASGTVPSSSAESSATPPAPEPTPVPAAEIDLAQLPWYDLIEVAFGYFEPPPPDASPLPDPYSELRVGTLDGHVAAELQLAVESFANGPFGTEVLVGQDNGEASELMLVSTLDGSTRDLFSIADLVVRAALSPDGRSVYYVPIDRSSGIDRGLWRFSLDAERHEPAQGDEMAIAAGPNDYASRWLMEWSPDGDYLVTQVCRVRSCRQLVHRAADGSSRLDDQPAQELLGVTYADYLVSSSLEGGRVLAVDLPTGERRTVGEVRGYATAIPGGEAGYVVYVPYDLPVRAYQLIALSIADGSRETLVDRPPDQPTEADIVNGQPGEYGASIPDGWVLRWPPKGGPHADMTIAPHEWFAGELINVVSGERLRVPAFAGTLAQPGCETIGPSELPSGAEPGEPIETYGGPFRWATWGAGTDQVVEVIGGWPFGNPTAGHTPVTIRGLQGWVHSMGSSDGPYAIMWQENGCLYEARLTPGGTLEQAIDYAARY